MKLSYVREGEADVKRWLRRLREDAGLSQRALAEIVGVSTKTIVNAESESSDQGLPHGFNLLKILRELGAVTDSPDPADRPLARLEAKVDEVIFLVTRALELLDDERGSGGAREASP